MYTSSITSFQSTIAPGSLKYPRYLDSCSTMAAIRLSSLASSDDAEVVELALVKARLCLRIGFRTNLKAAYINCSLLKTIA